MGLGPNPGICDITAHTLRCFCLKVRDCLPFPTFSFQDSEKGTFLLRDFPKEAARGGALFLLSDPPGQLRMPLAVAQP